MLNWFKNIFGITPKREEPLVLTQDERIKETPKPKKSTASKPKKKTQKIVDFSKLSKTELLAEAKKQGVKANASLKKEEILDRLTKS